MTLSSDDLGQRAAEIRLVAFDVDGVMTDGRLYLDDHGRETKAFNSRDGLGLKALMRHGIAVAVITARNAPLVHLRMRELGIKHLRQGREDKRAALVELLAQLDLEPRQAAYMGDDVVDWPAMRYCGLMLAPGDADPWIRQHAHWLSQAPGGRGAVREACELLLAAHGKLDAFRETWT